MDAAGHPVLMPNVAATLARERQRFDMCFIVSNQARISRGEISLGEVYRRFAWADEELGGPFTDWRLCPHGDEHSCGCRKPRPGMFLELAALHGVDLRASTHVGDSERALHAEAERAIAAHDAAARQLHFGDALAAIFALVDAANKHYTRTQPWVLAKDAARRAEVEGALYAGLEAVRLVAYLLWPYMPTVVSGIAAQLGAADPASAPFAEVARWGLLRPGDALHPAPALFPRLDRPAAG